jgi:secreted Zn-dependent insulinase-like peptidase
MLINNIIHNYLLYLKTVNWDKYFDYYNKNSQLNYEYNLKDEYQNLVIQLASNSHLYKPINIYNGSKLVFEKDISSIIDTLKFFDNVNIIYSTKRPFKEIIYSTEKYYNRKYGQLLYSLKNNKIINYKFNLPYDIKMIDFMPNNILDLDKKIVPTRLTERFWYGGVSKFKEPFVMGNVYINSNSFFNTVENYLLTNMSVVIINHYIDLYFYELIKIGYNFKISSDILYGYLMFSLFGYNYNFVQYFNLFFDKIKNIKPDINIFNITVNALKTTYENIKYSSPSVYAKYISDVNIYKFCYTYESLL